MDHQRANEYQMVDSELGITPPVTMLSTSQSQRQVTMISPFDTADTSMDSFDSDLLFFVDLPYSQQLNTSSRQHREVVHNSPGFQQPTFTNVWTGDSRDGIQSTQHLAAYELQSNLMGKVTERSMGNILGGAAGGGLPDRYLRRESIDQANNYYKAIGSPNISPNYVHNTLAAPAENPDEQYIHPSVVFRGSMGSGQYKNTYSSSAAFAPSQTTLRQQFQHQSPCTQVSSPQITGGGRIESYNYNSGPTNMEPALWLQGLASQPSSELVALQMNQPLENLHTSLLHERSSSQISGATEEVTTSDGMLNETQEYAQNINPCYPYPSTSQFANSITQSGFSSEAVSQNIQAGTVGLAQTSNMTVSSPDLTTEDCSGKSHKAAKKVKSAKNVNPANYTIKTGQKFKGSALGGDYTTGRRDSGQIQVPILERELVQIRDGYSPNNSMALSIFDLEQSQTLKLLYPDHPLMRRARITQDEWVKLCLLRNKPQNIRRKNSTMPPEIVKRGNDQLESNLARQRRAWAEIAESGQTWFPDRGYNTDTNCAGLHRTNIGQVIQKGMVDKEGSIGH